MRAIFSDFVFPATWWSSLDVSSSDATGGTFLKFRMRNSLTHAAVFSLMGAENQQGTTIMDTIVPLISSGVAGPLGVLHLPRLWLKASLEARGKLAAGYPGAGKGYDQMVIDGLGLDRQKVLDYIKTNRPTYTQFESWVKSQPGAKVDKASIDNLNNAIKGYIHDDGTRKGIFGACGLDDSKCNFRDAVNLNNLDDWNEFHAAALK
jgi:hypothetical protein